VGAPTFTYSRELSEEEVRAFNPWNLLRAAPSRAADDRDRAGVRGQYEGAGNLIYRIALTGSGVTIGTGGPGATIGATVVPKRTSDAILPWSTKSDLVSQSLSKSIVSILVGAAAEEGAIKSIEDPVTKYLPYLSTSGYRNVTVKNLLQMSTGVNCSEDYRDPKSGAALIGAALLTGNPSFKDYAQSIQPTNTPPGTKFEYQSVNTLVFGLLLEKVTGKRLNQYAQDKLWRKIGAQSDAFFYESKQQPDTCAFACLNTTVRDYARVGLMMLRGGMLGEERVVSSAWVHDSTTPDAPCLKPKPGSPEGGDGYAYQWWVPAGNDRVFTAQGIYGQCIYVNPARQVVIVQTSAWPEPVSYLLAEEQGQFSERLPASLCPECQPS
jgi:CubicO group peptidase (beta-lactamase class C family)